MRQSKSTSGILKLNGYQKNAIHQKKKQRKILWIAYRLTIIRNMSIVIIIIYRQIKQKKELNSYFSVQDLLTTTCRAFVLASNPS